MAFQYNDTESISIMDGRAIIVKKNKKQKKIGENMEEKLKMK